MIASPVMAADYAVNGDADVATFTKTIAIPDGASVPTIEYTYAVTAGSAIAGTESTMNIYAGNDPDRTNGVIPSALNIAFSSADNGSIAENKIVKSATLDFSGTRYFAPGVYRYVITETGDVSGVTEAADRTFACDVYVMDDNGLLKIGGYIIHTDETSGAAKSDTSVVLDDKIEGLTATFEAKNLTVNKIVSGNQGIRDEYFPFTINFTGATPNSTINVDLSGADAVTVRTLFNEETHTNPATVSIGADGTGTAEFWLKNGQAVTFQGMNNSAGYSIRESENTGDTGYTTSIATTGDMDGVTTDDTAKTTSDTGITADTTVVYTNTTGGVVPTGLFMTIGGATAITLIGVVGVTVMLRKKKDDEE